MKVSATQAATIRKSILQIGIHLIRQNGPTVGIQEIADKVKIPKGSFYNYFSSKDQFLIEALEEYTQNAILWNDQTLKKGKQKLFYRYEQKVILEKKFLQDGIS
ncbi:TetR/AcrR family transcriptional regulator, partial [Leptospira interrogans serovar Canicola]|uniref:TetR/AcrR family transcriptional regulator n=1 Tax=Leptospira interrogans TaxID=173 RepID=UPI001F0FF2B6